MTEKLSKSNMFSEKLYEYNGKWYNSWDLRVALGNDILKHYFEPDVAPEPFSFKEKTKEKTKE
jgi:hypothetical protein